MERVLFAPRALPPLPPDVAQDPTAYASWAVRHEAARVARAPATGTPPLHLVMVVDGPAPPQTVETLRSLERQTVARWTLTIVTHDSINTDVTSILAVSGVRHSSQRVRITAVDGASTAVAMLRLGLAQHGSSPVAVIFPGDLWAPDAVDLLGAALSPAGVAYADEDCRLADGSLGLPRLKPAYSPDFLLSSPYTGRPLALGAELVDRLLAQPAGETSAVEHDLALRACEAADRVVHVPEVLCHRTLGDDQRPTDGEPVVSALARRGMAATVTDGPAPHTFHISHHLAGPCTASIIIPLRDEPRFLRTCIDSVDATRGDIAVEYLLIDNGSRQPETATLLDALSSRPDVHRLSDDRPFNWAALNNTAAGTAGGDVLVFLNNDIEATTPGWLSTLCAQALRPEVGVVGARLLYPDRRVQHCGVVLGMGGAAGHVLVGLEADRQGYLQMAVLTRECAAVTGACLASRRQVFDALGGFDESLGVDLNDVDYCLRAQRAGWRVLVDPAVELVHYESPSRGTAGDVRDIVNFIDRWEASILAGDPFFNPRLTRVDSSCALRGPGEKEWWQQWRSTLARP
ncbi:MAG TPA: glycosyltransferase family 2 protein [Acidimicrobiales bacterium]|nr:glycosyltransferase family 2 protein [Acidimicrobiales bacterium]